MLTPRESRRSQKGWRGSRKVGERGRLTLQTPVLNDVATMTSAPALQGYRRPPASCDDLAERQRRVRVGGRHRDVLRREEA